MDLMLRHESRTPIQEFYTNSNIFITGGTGFLGKILIEKLLRSCPDLNKIFLLIREKKGKGVEARLDEIFEDELFDSLKNIRPKYREKITAIYGDCAQVNLGLSDDNYKMLTEDVTIIFHSAATVRFDEKLQLATFINIRGTRELLNLSRMVKNLKFVTHVSTAYAHCVNLQLKESFYEYPIKAHELITIAENLDERTMENVTNGIIGSYPNTYAFTKSIAEQLVEEYHDLPLAVYRPAIIVSTYKEPIPGWINNFYGPQGVSTAVLLGLLRSLHCDENVNSNIVPVDMSVNALIAIPWKNKHKFETNENHNVEQKTNEIPIYHFESNTYCPISWKEFRYMTHFYGRPYPSIKMIGPYYFHLRKNLIHHKIAIFFLHYLPACIFDFALVCIGKKPMLRKAYEKIHKFSNVISYFSTKNWEFNSKNLGTLCDSMDDADKKLFFCDLRKLDWREFFKTYLRGCRIYLVKDPLDTVDAAQKRIQRINLVSALFLIFLGLLLVTGVFYVVRCF